jgi:surfeit locus 1 family protein
MAENASLRAIDGVLQKNAMQIRFASWRFAPRLWPTLAAAVFLAATLALGNWQSHRAETKRALQARIDAGAQGQAVDLSRAPADKDALLYRHVRASGVFETQHEILIDNRIHRGVAGYHVLTPLRIDGAARHVLVNRGWIAAGPNRDVLPHVNTPTGPVTIEGIAIDPRSRYLEIGPASPQGRVWQNLDFARYARATGLALDPVVIQQTSDTGDGLVRDWPRADAGVAMHVSYALQWYGLAATLAVLWVVLNLERVKRSPPE